MSFTATLLYWKVAIFRVSGKALVAVVLSIAQALNGIDWGSFTPTQKFICIALAIGSGWSIIDAFLDQTLSQIRRNPDGLGIPEDTQFIRKTKVDSHSETIETPKNEGQG